MSQNYPPIEFSIVQEIPVADHVYKYLLKICGGDKINASRCIYIGSLILSLQGRNYDVRPEKKKYTKLFKARISETYYNKTGLHIITENAQLFNDQVDKNFRDELYRNIPMNRHLEEKLFLKSMRAYLDFYDITEDDIKVESLYRDFKRKKDDLLVDLSLNIHAGTKYETSLTFL